MCLVHGTKCLGVTGKTEQYRIAGNFRWVQIFADRPASAKINREKINYGGIDDVITCVCRVPM